MKTRSSKLTRSAVSLILSLVLADTTTHAAQLSEATQFFDIPPASRTEALNAFSRQTGLRVLFSYDAVAGLQADAIKGNYKPAEVLEKLLAGTSLHYEVTPDAVVILKGPHEARNTPSSARSEGTALAAKSGSTEPAGIAARVPENTSTAGPAQLEEVIVTAQKRNERMFDVPMALSSISSQDLTERNQIHLRDYFASVPGLTISEPGNGFQTIAIRGIITGLGTNPTVGVAIDDVPFGSSTLLTLGARLVPDLDPATLSRVEVLRGPQGPLYGASSLGGVLKYVTVDPDTSGFKGHVDASGSAIDAGGVGYGLRAAVNVPINNTLALSANGFVRRDPGYVDNVITGQNDVNSADVRGGRVAALWRPLDSLSIKLSALIQRTDGDGSAAVDTDYRFNPTRPGLTQTYMPYTGPYRKDIDFYSAIINYDLGLATLTSLTGYNSNKYSAHEDYTGAFGGLAGFLFGPQADTVLRPDISSTHKFTQELRLASAGNNRLDWMVGGFYTHESSYLIDSFTALDSTTGQTQGVVLASVGPALLTETAGFGNLTWHITDALALQGGARYSKIEESYSEIDTGAALGGETLTLPPASTTAHPTTYLASLQYRFSPDLMAYVRSASGYRAGGPNPGAPLGFAGSYDPDKTYNYELGAKGYALNRMLSFDGALYYIDWRHIQLINRDLDSGFNYFTNGGRAKSEGVELSLTAEPLSGLRISANAAYNVAELTQDLPATSSVGLAGDRLPQSPRFATSLLVDEEFPLNGHWRAFGGGTLSYVGDRMGDFPSAGSIRLRYPSYTTLDLRAGVRSDAWTARLFLTNITNERGVLGGNLRNVTGTATTSSPYTAFFLQPATIGLGVSYEF